MTKRNIKRVVFVWIFLIAVVALFGKVTVAATNSGRRAADFLLIGSGAASAGMSGAYTSLGSGARAAYWNPASLANSSQHEIMLSHIEWYQDIKMEHLAASYGVNDRFNVGFSFTYLGYGTINGYDGFGYETNEEISAYDLATGLSFGYKVNEDLSVGLTSKFINQNIDDLNGTTVAFDLGFKYMIGKFTIGGVAANFGPQMKFETEEYKLPYTARLGASFAPLTEATMVSVELEKRSEGDYIFKNGYEYNFSGEYFLRTGYSYFPNQDERVFGSGLSFGAGIKRDQLEFDYAFTPSDKFSSQSLHRLSIVFKIGH